MIPKVFFVQTGTRPLYSENVSGNEYAVSEQVLGADLRCLCPRCGEVIRVPKDFPPLRVVDGDMWPDFIGASAISRTWYVSARVAQCIANSNIHDTKALPLGDVTIVAKYLSAKDMPIYYDLRIESTIKIDYDHEGSVPNSFCTMCSRPYTYGRPQSQYPRPLFEEWADRGLAKLDTLGPSGIYCTWDFVMMAREQRWTGVAFKASFPTAKEMGFRCSKRFDLFADTWPPSIWYED